VATETSENATLRQRAMRELKELVFISVYLYIILGAVILAADERPVSGGRDLVRTVVDGEGFRMPAITGRASRHGPAYENRPSTNPRGCGDALWGLRVLFGRGDGETNSVLASAGT
jgi:hypothetical protein